VGGRAPEDCCVEPREVKISEEMRGKRNRREERILQPFEAYMTEQGRTLRAYA